jgi:hypothetical protein
MLQGGYDDGRCERRASGRAKAVFVHLFFFERELLKQWSRRRRWRPFVADEEGAAHRTPGFSMSSGSCRHVY